MIDQADLVITHGGTGSVLGLIARRKRFVAVANTELQDDHQSDFLARLAEECSIEWCRGVDALEVAIERVLKAEPAEWRAPRLADDLLGFLDRSASG